MSESREQNWDPLISIVVPTLNEERYLPKLLECLRRQTYPYYEIIVADAGSRDDTTAIAAQYGCIVTTGGRVAEGRNAGAKMARGEFLCFLDSDVLVDAKFLETAVAEITERALDVAGCTLVPITRNMIRRFAYSGYNTYMKIVARFGIPRAIGSCILVSKKLFDKVGGFDPSVQYAEDHAFAVECGKYGAFGYLRNCTHYTSTRRFMKDGLLSLILKSIFCDLHLSFFGPIRHNLIKYDMSGYDQVYPDDSFPCEYEFFENHVFRTKRKVD